MRTSLTRSATAAAYLLTIFLANYAITHIGHPPIAPGAPHTLPVWPGINAPSGVYVVGVTLVLRDIVQRQSGPYVTFALIIVGTALTAFLSPALAVASGVAFFASESVDWALFTMLEKRTYYGAILISNAASIAIDSVLFLTLAFHSLAYIDGQIIGKAFGTVAAVLVLMALRARDARQAATT